MRRLIVIYCIFSSYCSLFAQVESTTLLFDFDQFKLKSTELKKIDALLDKHRGEKIVSVTLSAHTDGIGATRYNERLASLRLNSVEAYFTNRGLTHLVKSNAFGERKPIQNNATVKGRASNRRVEIQIEFELNPVEKNEVSESGDIRDLYALLKTPVTEFCINPKRDTVLVGKHKGIVVFKAHSLANVDPKTTCVKITMRENFTYSSMVKDNLVTLSNGKLLESDGMMEIKAFDINGKELQLHKGQEILYLIPTDDKKEDMLFFNGLHSPQSNTINWVLNDFDFENRLLSRNGVNLPSNECINKLKEPGCSRCRIWCRMGRIGQGFQGLFIDSIHKQNKMFRERNRACKNKNSRGCRMGFWFFGKRKCDSNCENIEKLMKKYGVKSYAALIDTLKKEEFKHIEDKIKNRTIDVNEMQYYLFSKQSLGYANCDRFASIPEDQKTNMYFNLRRTKNTDVKVVFQKEKIIMNASDGTDKFQLNKVPKGKKVWVLALKIVGGAFFMDLIEHVIGTKTPEFNWKKVSLEEMNQAIDELDK